MPLTFRCLGLSFGSSVLEDTSGLSYKRVSGSSFCPGFTTSGFKRVLDRTAESVTRLNSKDRDGCPRRLANAILGTLIRGKLYVGRKEKEERVKGGWGVREKERRGSQTEMRRKGGKKKTSC